MPDPAFATSWGKSFDDWDLLGHVFRHKLEMPMQNVCLPLCQPQHLFVILLDLAEHQSLLLVALNNVNQSINR